MCKCQEIFLLRGNTSQETVLPLPPPPRKTLRSNRFASAETAIEILTNVNLMSISCNNRNAIVSLRPLRNSLR